MQVGNGKYSMPMGGEETCWEWKVPTGLGTYEADRLKDREKVMK